MDIGPGFTPDVGPNPSIQSVVNIIESCSSRSCSVFPYITVVSYVAFQFPGGYRVLNTCFHAIVGHSAGMICWGRRGKLAMLRRY